MHADFYAGTTQRMKRHRPLPRTVN